MIVAAGLVSACSTYYEIHRDFNYDFERGNLNDALRSLRKDKRGDNGSARFLYMVNNGLLLSMLGKYDNSNDYFEKAYLFGEDYRVNYAFEFASYLTNPQVTVYRGEDHEHLMLLYYKALNYLKEDDYEEALVECRRLNLRLQQLSDKYTSGDKYRRDAFIHNLMGIIYQASGDWNNAFIAYRNSFEIYNTDYARLFHISAPRQLKNDLLTSAYMTGFTEEFERYKLEFGMEDFEVSRPDGELVFFWHDGLSPVKYEYNINFAIDHGSDNVVVFSNKNFAMSFPFHVDDDGDQSSLTDLEFFRVAFPRYAERPVYYADGSLNVNGTDYPLELAQDVNKIAFHSLEQRMFAEFSKTLLRAALKKAVEKSLRREDKVLGSLLGIVNAMTEKADTRNWQTLPHSIYYSRVPLLDGKNDATFEVSGSSGEKTEYTFSYSAKKRQTLFHTFSSLESLPANY